MNAVPAFAEAGSGPPLLFLHGIGGNRHSFARQLPAFADAWRAVAWDMPGYGETPLPERMTFAVLADAAAALIAALGEGPVAVVGHSMGGMVAQELVARHPDRVSALVLAGTSPAFGKPGGDWQKRFLADRLRPLDEGRVPADFADSLVDGMWGKAGREYRKPEARATMAALSAETYRAALNCIVTFDRRDALERIACPTLCLAAEEDSNAAPVVMEKMAARIPGAEYVCMPRAGHLMTVEDAEGFNAIVRDFLERQSR